jgi:hypothetical protein
MSVAIRIILIPDRPWNSKYWFAVEVRDSDPPYMNGITLTRDIVEHNGRWVLEEGTSDYSS